MPHILFWTVSAISFFFASVQLLSTAMKEVNSCSVRTKKDNVFLDKVYRNTQVWEMEICTVCVHKVQIQNVVTIPKTQSSACSPKGKSIWVASWKKLSLKISFYAHVSLVYSSWTLTVKHMIILDHLWNSINNHAKKQNLIFLYCFLVYQKV